MGKIPPHIEHELRQLGVVTPPQPTPQPTQYQTAWLPSKPGDEPPF